MAKMKKMKKIILIFGVLSLLVFIRPVLGFNSNTTSTLKVEQSEDALGGSFVEEALKGIEHFYQYTGFANLESGNLIMILIGFISSS